MQSALRKGLQSYSRMLAYVRPYWLPLLVAGVSLVLISLVTLAMPWAVQRLVDVVIVGKDFAQLNRIALVLAAVFGLRTVFGFVESYLIAWVGERVVANLRQETYDHLLSLSLGFFASHRVGDLLSRLGNDVQVIQSAVTSNLVILLQQMVTLFGVAVIVSTMNWRLAALMALAMPGTVLITRVMGRRIRQASRVVQDTLAEASAVAEETLGGVRVVQSFAREDHESARFAQRVDKLFNTAVQRARVYATLGPMISFLMYGSLALVLWVGGQEVLRGRLTPGQLIAFLFYAAMLTGPLGSFAGLYGRIQEALGATERVFELLDLCPQIVEDPDSRPLPPIAGHVVLNDVSFEYDPRQPVLRQISLEARPGQVIAVVGPSGVGKTTLVNLIARFYDPSAGTVTIDGTDIRQVTLHSLRDQIGLVPQETQLFSDTIAANIRYGRLDATQAEVEAAARAANAHEFIVKDLPDGYNSQAGERGAKLSAGQRQRIAIARAILKNPRILILDEATSSLDTESEQLVQEALERLMRPVHAAPGYADRVDKDLPPLHGEPREDRGATCLPPLDGGDRGGTGRTTFVIAHRLSTITNADCILVLHEGRIVEQGRHEELLARDGSLYRYYHALQFQWGEDRPAPPPPDLLRRPSEAQDWAEPAMPFWSPPVIES